METVETDIMFHSREGSRGESASSTTTAPFRSEEDCDKGVIQSVPGHGQARFVQSWCTEKPPSYAEVVNNCRDIALQKESGMITTDFRALSARVHVGVAF